MEIKEILSHTFSHKNFVKATFFIDKILKSWFHEIFFREREFLVFPHGNSLSHLYFFGKNFVKVSVIDRLLKRWFHGFFLVWENFSLDEIFARKSWKWNSIIPHIVNFWFSCKFSVKLIFSYFENQLITRNIFPFLIQLYIYTFGRVKVALS